MGRAFLAPEIMQISSMDCGVAAVACVLSGFGIQANYEKLREACQTSVDGTSIDSLEDLCLGLGLDFAQHIVPPDLLSIAMRRRMPCIAVVTGGGSVHFVVMWRQVADVIQLMDPTGGRQWMRSSIFETKLHRHEQPMSVEDWRGWFATSSFFEALQESSRALLSDQALEKHCAAPFSALDPVAIGEVDAALRVVRRTIDAAGNKPKAWLDALFERTLTALRDGSLDLPESLWCIRVVDDDLVITSGSVVLAATAPVVEGAQATITPVSRAIEGQSQLSLFASMRAILGAEENRFVAWIALGMAALALASGLELLVYRSAPLLPRLVEPVSSRLGLSAALASLFLVLLGLETFTTYGGIRVGRLLELRLRASTLWSIPRASDAFVRSRPTTDLTYRAHALSMGALLVPSLVAAAKAAGDLAVTLGAMALLDIRYALVVLIGGFLFAAAWAVARSGLNEVDTRLQIHASRLLGILFDALRGIRPVRLHGYQDPFRDDQRAELEQWRTSAQAKVERTAALEARYNVLNVVIVAILFWICLRAQSDARQFVLLAFWSFRLPPIIRRLMSFAETYPLQRNAMLRFLEVTRYAAPTTDDPPPATVDDDKSGIAIELNDVSVVLAGQPILSDVALQIPPGQHVAIVGASGSGKSTLLSLLLGLHRPVRGTVKIDGAPLDESNAQKLRDQIAWIDPSIQLWNDSLGANLDYAARGYRRRGTLDVLEAADLVGVLSSVEHGFDTPLGAEGALVSGGEGQRVRIGRALFRAGTRLVLLDEPFRGLDRATRKRIMANVRSHSLRSTMIFVSHDISHALSFDRVLVVDGGRIVEDGSPQELSAQESSHFARLLAAEQRVFDSAWVGSRWRRLRIEDGKIREVDNRA